jgi:Fungal protein kinase
LIRLISSLAYANVAELGYDPTMELFWTHNKWNYQITVKGKDNHQNVVTKVYKTIDIIADMSSNLRGRATRVYEAYDVENPGTMVVIKDSWVDVNRPKEGDTLSEILDGASDDEKAMFLTVLNHGVVSINGREDLTQDLIMNGYLVSTDSPKSDHKTENFSSNVIDALEKIMADVGIADHGRVEDTAQDDLIYEASIFEILRPSKPGSQPESLVTSPDVSTSNKTRHPPRVYGPKAHYRIVFKERGQSLHSMSCMRQIKVRLVVQAMRDILEGSMILSDGASGPF